MNAFTEGENFLDSYLSNKEYIYISSITKEYCEFAHNWFLSLKNINQHNFALMIAFDKEGYEYLLKNNIPCVFLDLKIQSNNTLIEWKENEKQINVDPRVYISKKYKINIINSEVDIVFFKNPINKLKEELTTDYDILCLSDKRFDHFVPNRKKDIVTHLSEDKKTVNEYGKTYQSIYGLENFGFSYNPHNQKIINFWENFKKNSEYINKFPKYSEAGNIQTILIKGIKEFNIRVKKLSPFEFVNGMVWSVPYLRERIKDNCYLIHYNGCDDITPTKSKIKKIKKMKEYNHWYI
jgi:hypothetical protein